MKPTVALNILTRNAARFVIRAIESAGLVHEVVIIDTGSTDDSKEILRNYLQNHGTVKKFTIVNASPEKRLDLYVRDEPESFPGLHLPRSEYTGKLMLADFAGARQEGLAETVSDFVFFLDLDDVIKSGDSGEIFKVASYLHRHKKHLGITPYVHRFLPAGNANTPGINRETFEGTPCSVMARASFGCVGFVKWQGAVHEHLVSKEAPFGQSANESVVFEAPLTIDLFDRDDPASRVSWRNLKILHRSYEKNQDRSAHVLFHLGLESREAFPEKAIRYFKESSKDLRSADLRSADLRTCGLRSAGHRLVKETRGQAP